MGGWEAIAVVASSGVYGGKNSANGGGKDVASDAGSARRKIGHGVRERKIK